ncbi:MAG: cupin domain-containing protein [Betaproteobacteria bacterium]|nr:cupin domain-containing protein [Betaproteobacteria bacterium]
MKRIAVVLLVTAASVAAPLQAADEVSLNKDDMKWGDVPPVLPKGAKLAVLRGDPGKPGPFTLRLNAPANYKIAPHWHSQAEDLTIISGALYLGMGDKMDTKAAHALKAGGFHYLPAKMHHYAFSKSPTVIQISGEGPFDINYLNPKDDPSGSQK